MSDIHSVCPNLVSSSAPKALNQSERWWKRGLRFSVLRLLSYISSTTRGRNRLGDVPFNSLADDDRSKLQRKHHLKSPPTFAAHISQASSVFAVLLPSCPDRNKKHDHISTPITKDSPHPDWACEGVTIIPAKSFSASHHLKRLGYGPPWRSPNMHSSSREGR